MAGKWDYPLTPDEMNALNYSRQNMTPERGMVNADGSMTTFMGAVEGVNGKQMYFPTYWDKQVLPRQEAIQKALRSGIDFPQYDTVDEALAREKFIKNYINQDTQEYFKRKRK